MKKGLWMVIGCLTLILLSVNISQVYSAIQASGPKRVLDLQEILRLSQIPENAKEVRIWIPTPPNDPYQSVSLQSIKAPSRHKTLKDQVYGNPLLYFELKEPLPETLDLSVAYRIVRREQTSYTGAKNAFDPLFLKPRGLVIIDERIQKITDETTAGRKSPLEKARAIYDYVLQYMKYDKSGKGWGRGDVVYACDARKGNCTDFHSLFIALCRAAGIPAEFKMGYPVPKAPQGVVDSKYHCWAEFYVKETGWVPVDISEAWKHPEKANYLFGHLDEDRVLLTTGREIILSPPQKSGPLNYLAGPYVEVDGEPWQQIEVERRYNNI